MILLLEGRAIVREGFEAMFAREGVPLTGMGPREALDWITGADRRDLDLVELVLVGAVDPDDETFATVRERCAAPLIAVRESGGLDGTLNLFSLGADDVVRVPVHPREILARAAAIRCRRRAERDRSLRFGLLTVHVDGRDPEIDGAPLPLPRRERRVLEVLAGSNGRFVSKAQLFSAVYGMFRTDVEESSIESHVSKLRRKLRQATGTDPITARRFQGYAMLPSSREPRASIAA